MNIDTFLNIYGIRISAIILVAIFILIVFAIVIPSASASQIYIARGDPAIVQEYVASGTCWYFPASGSGTLYDIPAVTYFNGSACELSSDQTNLLKTMQYTLLYEEPVVVKGKTFKDVSYRNGTLFSSFSGIHSIDESGMDGPTVLSSLKNMIDSNQFNTYNISYIAIQNPELVIDSLGQTGDNAYTVTGTSNYADGTQITLYVDRDSYAAQHITNFTYHTTVDRPTTQIDGNWISIMNMPLQGMPTGWHNLSVTVGDISTEVRFKIDEREWAPGPTPTQYVKYLSNGDIAPVIVTVTVPPVIVTQEINVWHTATPTPDITDALGNKVTYPYVAGDKIPATVGIGAFVGVAGLVLVRGRFGK